MACAKVVCVKKEEPCEPSSEVRGREGNWGGGDGLPLPRPPAGRSLRTPSFLPSSLLCVRPVELVWRRRG
jgi:hypothetical protein